MDGIDAVLADISEDSVKTLSYSNTPFPSRLKARLLTLSQPGDNEIQQMGEADVELGELFAEVCNEIITQNHLKASDIVAIGCHGQTIRHSVDSAKRFSLQIGNPSVIAENTDLTVVADFRMADIACMGQGAPLAPAFHESAFSSKDETRFIVNLGGIANLTYLNPKQDTIGFDTGPANTLLDQWILHCHDEPYDKDGAWAQPGNVQPDLLNTLLEEPFFSLPSPKSTGRELFNLNWLQQRLVSGRFEHLPAADIQRTLVELSAVTISNAIKAIDETCEAIYLCGGGVFNPLLVERIQACLPHARIDKTDALGVHSQQVEACTFAWLAKRTMDRQAGNLPSVTGASRQKVLGGIYLP